MPTPSTKEKLLHAVQQLPQDATFEEAMERMYFLYKVERGLEQANAGETISHEEAMQHLQQWRA